MDRINIDSAFLDIVNIFESMRAYGGEVFCLEEHLSRLEDSAKSVGIKISCSRKGLKQKILKKLKTSKLKDAYIRLSINFRGGLNIIIRTPKICPELLFEKGVEIITVPTIKDPINSLCPQAKTGNFLNSILARIEAGNFFEAILLNREGFITEGTVSNIFVVKNRILITPPLYLGILAGITRGVIIKLARKTNLRVEEIPFSRHELYNADEVFLSNTSIEIMPVAGVDNRRIKTGIPGSVTRLLRKNFFTPSERKPS